MLDCYSRFPNAYYDRNNITRHAAHLNFKLLFVERGSPGETVGLDIDDRDNKHQTSRSIRHATCGLCSFHRFVTLGGGTVSTQNWHKRLPEVTMEPGHCASAASHLPSVFWPKHGLQKAAGRRDKKNLSKLEKAPDSDNCQHP